MDSNIEPVDPTGNRKQRRARLASGKMDKRYRRYTKALSPVLMRGARDYYSSMLAAGHDPLKVTGEGIEAAYQAMVALGQPGAWARRLAWVVALHALPAEYQAEIGADQIAPAQRGSARSASPPDGQFPSLEAGIDALGSEARRSPASDCDKHVQRSEPNLRRARVRALIVAKRLHDAGIVAKDVTIEGLLATTMITKYIQLAYQLIKPANEGDGVAGDVGDDNKGDDDDGHDPVLAFRLLDDLTALVLLATLRYGAKSKQANFTRRQRKKFKHPPLSAEAVTELTALTQPTQLLKILDLQNVWMAKAEAASHPKTRVHWADLAAAVAIARTMLCRPRDSAEMRLDGCGEPVIRLRRAETIGSLKVPDDVREILTRRNAVRGIGEGEESWLFPGKNNGPQLERCVSKSFAKATAAAGLIGLTLQRMRDVGAIVMLRAKPGSFRRVAALLEYTEVRMVERRFRAFLQPTTSNGKD